MREVLVQQSSGVSWVQAVVAAVAGVDDRLETMMLDKKRLRG